MALYENGKRISGIRDFPAYTWAEYHALPAAKRPKVWKCTDRDYTEISALNIDSLIDISSSYNITPYKFQKYGKLVVLSFQAIANTSFASQSLNQIATVDASIRPSTNRFSCFICSDAGGNPITSANCLLFSDGRLCIVPISSCKIAAGTMSYLLD